MTMTTLAVNNAVPLAAALGIALLAACVWRIATTFIRSRSLSNVRKDQGVPSLPDPDPYYEFDINTATTRNHVYVNKAVRYPYFQTMAHQPMHINDWIEIDKDLRWYIDRKAEVIKEHGKDVIDSLPDNDDACAELLEVLVDYLPKRYPTLFEQIPDGIWNKVTDEKLTGFAKKRGVDALLVVSRLVQDDFLMGREREDGQVWFVGGLVAFPGFYLLSHQINKPLVEVHAAVPHFNEKILTSVERTLKRFPPEKPFERTSWGIADDRNLFLHNISAKAPMAATQKAQDLYLRLDHQTFRKLPRTNGIVFGVHPILKRIEDLADSPLVPALLAKVHEDMEPEMMDYKLAPTYKDILIPYLHELTQRQIQQGLITDAENVAAFRDLVRGGKIPNTHTSLTIPTESEVQTEAQRVAGNIPAPPRSLRVDDVR